MIILSTFFVRVLCLVQTVHKKVYFGPKSEMEKPSSKTYIFVSRFGGTNIQKASEIKNYQQIQAISIALNAAAKLLEEEWTRQPILIFGLRAGRAVYGLIASLIVSAMSSIGSSYIGRKATP